MPLTLQLLFWLAVGPISVCLVYCCLVFNTD
jgi:hypothetical protein